MAEIALHTSSTYGRRQPLEDIQESESPSFLKLNRPIAKKIRYTIMLTCVVFIIITKILNNFYSSQLFAQSIGFIYEYQQRGNSFITLFYNFFSFVGGTSFTTIILNLILLVSIRKANAYILITFVIANVYVMALTKIASANLRPTWYSPHIEQLQWKCETTYGFPSGHCWTALILWSGIVSDFSNEGPCRIGLAIPPVFVLFVALSRLYLGSHSSDQVVTSICYSFAICGIYRFGLQKQMWKGLNALVSCEKALRIKALVIVVITNLLILILPVILYEINVQNNTIAGNIQRINQICDMDLSVEKFEGRQSTQASIGNILPGFFYGLLLYPQYFLEGKPGANESCKIHIIDFLQGRWTYEPRKCRNFVVGFAISIAMIVSILVFTFVAVPSFVDNFYVEYSIKAMGWIVMGIVSTRIIPQVLVRLNLIQYQQGEQTMEYIELY